MVQCELCLREDVLGIANLQLDSIAAEGFTIGKTIQGQQTQTRIGDVKLLLFYRSP